MCLNIGTAKNHHFPFGTNGKVVVLGDPILKHFRVLISLPYKCTGRAVALPPASAASIGGVGISKMLKL